MSAHTHDGIDWVARLADLRVADAVNTAANQAVATRLINSLPAPQPIVLDVGSGAGGMSAALAAALADRGSGTVVLVDAVPELLAAAAEHVEQALADPATASPGGNPAAGPGAGRGAGRGEVLVRTVPADLAAGELPAQRPAADLVWAANVVHHLPDQRRAVEHLIAQLTPGGCLALAEGGLGMRCLPWDLGIGEPGLQDRLIAAGQRWFAGMRADIPGAVALPVGWNRVLTEAGLANVTAFSYLVDLPAPLTDIARQSVLNWLTWMTGDVADLLADADRDALHRLLDPTDPAYVGTRDDVFVLKASTVHLGWASDLGSAS